MKTIVALVPIAMLASACTAAGPGAVPDGTNAAPTAQPQAMPLPPAPEGSSGWLKPGETADMGPQITPMALVEDSRCPPLVQCVWAGRVRVDSEITLSGGARVVHMTLTMGEPVNVADGKVTLVAVHPDKQPEAQTAEASAPAAYRFAYRFDGGL